MGDNRSEKFVSKILLINGIADVIIALVMIFGGSLMGATTGLEYYIGGGWGIATIALGIWRIWASRKPDAYWVTAMGGVIEGGLLAIFSIISIFIYSLLFSEILTSFFFGLTFAVLYTISFILRKMDKGE